jgi:hypothetical protein
MLIVAHRGLLEGPDADKENRPDQIQQALAEGFDVEIDLWRIDHTWMLGHDVPKYMVSDDFIKQDGLWIHCKNLAAFFYLRNIGSEYNFFWHDSDLVVMTSRFLTWTYFGKPETMHNKSVCVMPEVTYDWPTIERMYNKNQWYGFCTDYPGKLAACKR